MPPRPTPVQIKLPYGLRYRDGLFLCREGKREQFLDLIYDSGLGSHFDVQEVTKDLKPAHLSKYDLVLVDDNTRLSSNLLKRRHFPFPVTTKQLKQQASQALETTAFMIQGGRNFELKVARTESMSVKEAVKNVITAVVNVASLIVYCG